MAENTNVFTLTQIGREGTAGVRGVPGTVVPAMAWKIDPDMTFQQFAPMGWKRNVEVVIGKEWTTFEIEGYGCFNCLPYVLGGVYGTATITAGSVTTWAFTPLSNAADQDVTFTIQNGSSVRAIDATYGRVTSFNYHIDREKFEIGGNGFAQRMTEGTTLQGSTKTVDLKPILPQGCDVWVDTTSGGLGSTKLTRLLSLDYELGDKANPLWAINSANTSFVADVEVFPSATLKMVVEHDASNGGTLYHYLRSGQRLFIRVQGTGDVIQGGTAYTFRHDMCVEASAAPPFGDQDGVRTQEYTYTLVHDATWGKSETLLLYNLQTGY